MSRLPEFNEERGCSKYIHAQHSVNQPAFEQDGYLFNSSKHCLGPTPGQAEGGMNVRRAAAEAAQAPGVVVGNQAVNARTRANEILERATPSEPLVPLITGGPLADQREALRENGRAQAAEASSEDA